MSTPRLVTASWFLFLFACDAEQGQEPCAVRPVSSVEEVVPDVGYAANEVIAAVAGERKLEMTWERLASGSHPDPGDASMVLTYAGGAVEAPDSNECGAFLRVTFDLHLASDDGVLDERLTDVTVQSGTKNASGGFESMSLNKELCGSTESCEFTGSFDPGAFEPSGHTLGVTLVGRIDGDGACPRGSLLVRKRTPTGIEVVPVATFDCVDDDGSHLR